MTQHGLRKGLKEFGNAGVEAVTKELQQLHDRNILEPINPNSITSEHKARALPYLMFLKKDAGELRGRDARTGVNSDST
jgi:hypothetical protein